MPKSILWALLLAALAAGCGQGGAQVTLAELADEQKFRDGDAVIVEGRVDMAEEPRHYWLGDDDFHRVGLRPDDAVTDHVGDTVTVRGRFSYSPEEGRWIEVESVGPTSEDVAE